MQVRVARSGDLAAIVACADLAFVSGGQGYGESATLEPAENIQLLIRQGSIWLVCDGGHVLGYISFWPMARQMFVDTLAILPKYRRRGLGSWLLACAEAETVRLGHKSITLFTKSAMTGNTAFYQSRGYRETGRCDDDGFCRIFFKKRMREPFGADFAPRAALKL